MTETTVRRAGWTVAAVGYAGWLAVTVYLAYRVLVVGLSPAQRRAAEQFPARPLEAAADPLVALLFLTLFAGILIEVGVLYYGYARWRTAKRRRIELERPFDRPRE